MSPYGLFPDDQLRIERLKTELFLVCDSLVNTCVKEWDVFADAYELAVERVFGVDGYFLTVDSSIIRILNRCENPYKAIYHILAAMRSRLAHGEVA